MFSNIRAEGEWDVEGPLLWGYFFKSGNPSALKGAQRTLTAAGYRHVDTYASDKDKPEEPDLWWLHVERVEQHTVDTLHALNAEFEALAGRYSATYDGMDVGPPP